MSYPVCFPHPVIGFAGITDRHQSESAIGITGLGDRHHSESPIDITGIRNPWAYEVQDVQPYLNRGWAKGRSQQKKLETQAKANRCCERCGVSGVTLHVHHPNRLANAKRVSKGQAHVAQSGFEQETILLCHACHMEYHHHASH